MSYGEKWWVFKNSQKSNIYWSWAVWSWKKLPLAISGLTKCEWMWIRTWFTFYFAFLYLYLLLPEHRLRNIPSKKKRTNWYLNYIKLYNNGNQQQCFATTNTHQDILHFRSLLRTLTPAFHCLQLAFSTLVFLSSIRRRRNMRGIILEYTTRLITIIIIIIRCTVVFCCRVHFTAL